MKIVSKSTCSMEHIYVLINTNMDDVRNFEVMSEKVNAVRTSNGGNYAQN
jgi:hypothetical protein